MKNNILLLCICICNGFMYGEFMKIKYVESNLNLMNLMNEYEVDDGKKSDNLQVSDWKIKRSAVASGYIEAIKNWWFYVNVVYNMTPKTNTSIFFRL